MHVAMYISSNADTVYNTMLWRTVKEYCANSTIHGLQFITQDGRHWVERYRR
jgi:hypothetical protein